MAPNKDRVYIALYVRGGAPEMQGNEDTYVTIIGLPYIVGSRGYRGDGSLMRTLDQVSLGHLVGPKLEDDGRYHAKERVAPSGTQWFFDEQDIPLAPTGMLLVSHHDLESRG